MRVLLQRQCCAERNILRTGKFSVTKLGEWFREDFAHGHEDSKETVG